MTALLDGELLFQLYRRHRFVERLYEGGADKRALAAELDVSRSTVDRAVRELEAAELVERDRGTVRLRPVGRLLVEEYRSLLDAVERVERADDLLSALPPDSPIRLDVLDGADVYPATRPAPYESIRHLKALVRTADRMRGCSKALSHAPLGRLLYHRTTNGDLELELVYEPAMIDYLLDSRLDERRTMVESGNFRPMEASDLPFALFLLEEDGETTVCVCAYDEDDDFRGLLINDTETAIEWAKAVYERHRSEAADVSDRFLSE